MNLDHLLAHLVTYLEASVTRSYSYNAHRIVLVTTPASDFAWLIGAPTDRTGQQFALVPCRHRDGQFYRVVPEGTEFWCLTRAEVEQMLRHPYGRHTGLYRNEH